MEKLHKAIRAKSFQFYIWTESEGANDVNNASEDRGQYIPSPPPPFRRVYFATRGWKMLRGLQIFLNARGGMWRQR